MPTALARDHLRRRAALGVHRPSQIGIAAIFGAFLFGLIMPRRAGLTADVSSRFENFVVLVLLPLFFVVTGLKTQVNGAQPADPLAI